jgi:hypothetical protein
VTGWFMVDPEMENLSSGKGSNSLWYAGWKGSGTFFVLRYDGLSGSNETCSATSTLGKPIEAFVHQKLAETLFLVVQVEGCKRILDNVAKYTR